MVLQQKDILSRNIPENLKLSIAKRIERGLFAKVCPFFVVYGWLTTEFYLNPYISSI
jgi:hypothetical protein